MKTYRVTISPNQSGAARRPWRRPRRWRFLRSRIREEVSGFKNFYRLIWWRWDLTIEWT